jgi:hypothetical protein
MPSPNLNFSIEVDNSNGSFLFFRDTTTDYGINGNINYSDVKAIRMVMTNWMAQQNPLSLVAGDSLDQYRQYVKTNIGSSVYDNKTLTLASYFIPFISGLSVLSGDTFETTGAYSTYIDPSSYLPTSSFNVFVIPVSYFGLTETVFPNMVYGIQYEIYVDTDPDPLTNVVDEKQYIVHGTTGTAIWNGNTYRIGEVFIATDSGAVSFTGDATLKVLEASVNNYFAIVWDIQNRLYVYKATQTCKGCNDDITIIQDEIETFLFSNYTQWESISDAMATIAWCEERLTILETNAL